jgi:hypothetical protein
MDAGITDQGRIAGSRGSDQEVFYYLKQGSLPYILVLVAAPEGVAGLLPG